MNQTIFKLKKSYNLSCNKNIKKCRKSYNYPVCIKDFLNIKSQTIYNELKCKTIIKSHTWSYVSFLGELGFYKKFRVVAAHRF